MAPTPVRPVLLLEMNEIPWRVIDRVLGERRLVSANRFFRGGATYTTLSRDVGELSPWITWPSLHRGMSNTEHGIKNLGQDVSTFRGTPIWDEYRARGYSVGVCGSLQSWPPRDPGEGGFFVPDTFAHDASCIPAHIEPLQRFNLRMVARNGLVVRDESLLSVDTLRILPSALRARIRPKTYARILQQLVSERVERTRLARRPIFQTVLYWDVFRGLFDPSKPPAFSTFFTNHVAGVMHRYWDDVFPEDFPDRAPDAPRTHSPTMQFALEVMDEILSDALDFQARCPDLILVFATSMGQAAVHRDHEGFEAAIADIPKFMRAFGYEPEDYKQLLAMVPQIAVEIQDDVRRNQLRAALESARTASGKPMFLVDEVGPSLSITIVTPRMSDKERGGFTRSDAAASGSLVAWADAGIIMHQFEAGTAYHVPEGVLAIHGRGIAPSASRDRIEATAVKGMLMNLSGLTRPS